MTIHSMFLELSHDIFCCMHTRVNSLERLQDLNVLIRNLHGGDKLVRDDFSIVVFIPGLCEGITSQDLE